MAKRKFINTKTNAKVQAGIKKLNYSIVSSNIKDGDVLTYKSICDKLGQPHFTNDEKSKKEQIEMFSNFFEFDKVGCKFIVNHVYRSEEDKKSKTSTNDVSTDKEKEPTEVKPRKRKTYEELANIDQEDIKKVKIGQMYTYKELCKTLNQPVLGATGRKVITLHVKLVFCRYFEMEKTGKQYLITDIYKEPLPREAVENMRMKRGRKMEEFPMNVKNIDVGELIDYRNLCRKLGQPTFSSNQKKTQIEYFRRFFDLEKVDNKYIVNEIYAKPLPQEYVYSNRSIYTKYIETLLLWHLYKIDGYETTLTSKEMWNIFGFGNDTFNQYIDFEDELADLINKKKSTQLTKSDIKEQYNMCRNKFYQVVNSTLKSLQDRCMITYVPWHMVRIKEEIDGVVIRDETRKATESEESYIIEASNYALNKLGYSTMVQVNFHGANKDFYKIVHNYLSSIGCMQHIHSCWRVYNIIYSKKIIPNKIKDNLAELNKLCVNYEFKKYIGNKNLDKNNDMGDEEKMFELDEHMKKDYVEIGNMFADETLNLDIDNSELLAMASEIIKDTTLYKKYSKEINV